MKPITEYYWDRKHGRHQSCCKECMKAYASERVKRMREDPAYRSMENERWMVKYNSDEAFRKRHNARMMQDHRERRKGEREQVCANCINNPCFTGIETLWSNLALTCPSYHNKCANKRR